MRNWKYCTELEPWATACREEAMCIPGFFSLETGVQLVVLGVDSISRKGCPLMERITSCHRAKSAAVSTLPSLCHWG